MECREADKSGEAVIDGIQRASFNFVGTIQQQTRRSRNRALEKKKNVSVSIFVRDTESPACIGVRRLQRDLLLHPPGGESGDVGEREWLSHHPGVCILLQRN
ncbi:hypothetical protein ACSS6W_006161 [Trichoderma asperelloides]